MKKGIVIISLLMAVSVLVFVINMNYGSSLGTEDTVSSPYVEKDSVPSQMPAVYYLNNVSVRELTKTNWSIIVVEPEELSSSELQVVKKHSWKTLAYINLGYAEEWRSYFNEPAIKSIIHESSEYEGEYFVEYWNPIWIDTIQDLAVKYLREGYDGVYFDNIDASITLDEQRPSWASSVDPVEAMIETVCELSSNIKSFYGDEVLIIVNIGGAYSLLYNDSFLNCIDGVLREELWSVSVDSTLIPQDKEEAQNALDALVYAVERGKIVIVSDPVSDEYEASLFCGKCWDLGFIPVPQPAWAYDYTRPPPVTWCR
ncbi:MAG: endo alpha-1,4 polygalactosaminidase [Desulfurococcales archaeon]|nr:endo alpha-1,4 polygalactosaminidase [Desulfurococcales archaeon]